MQKWIEALFKEYLDSNPFPLNGEQNQANFKTEWDNFNTLYENLNGDNLELFLSYSRLRDTREGAEKQACFQQGFKTAIRCIMESLKE